MAVLIERAKSQLLVVDMQERLVPAMVEPAVMVSACGTLLQAANALQVPVLASEQYPKGLGHTVADLAPLIDPAKRREKVEFSCYANGAIKASLTGTGRRQVILAGVEAHVCVLQTALELVAADYAVFVVADAIASRRAESREIALRRMAEAGASLVTVEMVLFEWLRSAADPEFRNLSRLIR
jgi:nicotinamidase-related amidase